jgi:hypothetical protein
MAAPNQPDQLNQIPYWIQDPRSPLMAEVRKELAGLESQASKLDPKSPEFAKLNTQYQKQAAALLLTKIQGQFGGKIPDRKSMEDTDYAQRSGGDKTKEATLRQGQVEAPYSQAFNGLEQLQKLAGVQATPPTPASLVESGGGGGGGAPAAPMKRPPLKANATDEDKLSDSMLGMLFGLSQQASGAAKPQGTDPHVAQTLDEYDAPDIPQAPLAPAQPYDPDFMTSRQAQEPTAAALEALLKSQIR